MTDWKFLYPEIVVKLRQLYETGKYIVIISNQSGVTQGHITTDQVQQKFDEIVGQIGVPVDIVCSLGNSIFRKPAIGMWDFLRMYRILGATYAEGDVYTYVGDAAGKFK